MRVVRAISRIARPEPVVRSVELLVVRAGFDETADGEPPPIDFDDGEHGCAATPSVDARDGSGSSVDARPVVHEPASHGERRHDRCRPAGHIALREPRHLPLQVTPAERDAARPGVAQPVYGFSVSPDGHWLPGRDARHVTVLGPFLDKSQVRHERDGLQRCLDRTYDRLWARGGKGWEPFSAGQRYHSTS